MIYNDIDARMYSRNRSYVLTPMAVSPYVTREELEDAKNELRDLSKKRIELLEGIERDKKERDERISPEELQMLMFPVENVVRRIQELTYLIGHAQIVEKPSIIQKEEIQEALIDQGIITAEQTESPAGSTDSSSTEQIYEDMFFVKDGVKVEAKPGNRTPFYSFVDGEYVGFNRLILNGWVLVDNTGRQIEDIDEAWDISKVLYGKEIANSVQSTKEKYPNAFSPWTEAENERVIDLYSNQYKTLSEVAEILGRTKNGVSLQIKKLLGIDRLPYRKKQKNLDEYSLSPISITSINPSEIPDGQMPEYLDLIDQMEEWFKYVKKYAIQQAVENGVLYNGYEVHTSVKNTIAEPQKVIDAIREMFPEQYIHCISEFCNLLY